MYYAQIVIEGTRPLLLGRFPIEEGIATDSRSGRTKETPEAIAERKAYRMKDGTLYIPDSHVVFGLRTGARLGGFKIGRRSAWPLVTSAVQVAPERISIGTKDYEIDSQPTVNRSTGGRQINHRPRIDEWGLEFFLAINEDIIDPTLINKILVHTGLVDGVGTYRARYGKFKVVSWTEVDQLG